MFQAIKYIMIRIQTSPAYIKTSQIVKKIFLFLIAVCAASCVKVLADRAIAHWGPQRVSRADLVEQAILDMQKKLPIKLDDVTTLIGIGADQNTDKLLYSIQIENLNRKELYTSYDISSIKDQLSVNLCDSNKENFQNGFNNIEFTYFGNDDSEMFRIFLTPEICQKYNRQ